MMISKSRLGLPRRLVQVGCGVAVGALVAGGGYAIAAGGGSIHGCVSKSSSHALLIKSRCGRGQTPLVFAAQGPQGPRGRTGARGAQGVQGVQGVQGAQGPPGTPAVKPLWARVDSTGKVLVGNGIQVGHAGTGEYALFPTGGGPCAVTVTPDAVSGNGADQPATPITASVGTTGLQVPGAGITALLNNTMTGAEVDDGFSVTADC